MADEGVPATGAAPGPQAADPADGRAAVAADPREPVAEADDPPAGDRRDELPADPEDRRDHRPPAGDRRDELPADLDVSGFVGPYQFPDNSRRRIPGVMYLVVAGLCVLAWAAGHDSVNGLVNGGFLLAAGILAFAGVMSLTSSWRLGLDEKEALVAATRKVGFPVGHASAQMAWRGLRSRPTWRILLYSIENPPRKRGFVLVDAIDGHVVEHLVEDNPEEDWTEPS